LEQDTIALCVEQHAGEENGSSLLRMETFLKVIFNPTSLQEEFRKAEQTRLTRTASGRMTPVMNFYLNILEQSKTDALL